MNPNKVLIILGNVCLQCNSFCARFKFFKKKIKEIDSYELINENTAVFKYIKRINQADRLMHSVLAGINSAIEIIRKTQDMDKAYEFWEREVRVPLHEFFLEEEYFLKEVSEAMAYYGMGCLESNYKTVTGFLEEVNCFFDSVVSNLTHLKQMVVEKVCQ